MDTDTGRDTDTDTTPTVELKQGEHVLQRLRNARVIWAKFSLPNIQRFFEIFFGFHEAIALK